MGYQSDLIYISYFKKKKLFAHKVVLSIYSSYFREILAKDSRLKYIEVKSMDEKGMESQTFIKFLRILYSNYTGLDNSKSLFDDIEGLLRLAEEFKEDRLFDLLSTEKSITMENVGFLYRVSLSLKLDKMKESCINYWKNNFSEISSNSKVLSMWPKSSLKALIKLVKSKEHEKFYNWLDILWFSTNIEDENLKERSIEKLSTLLNIENATHVLIGAHSTGAKELRSMCVDFIVANGDSVEQYHRKTSGNDEFIPTGIITESLSKEVVDKMNDKAEERKKKEKMKECSFCGKKLGAFGNKKYNCAMCKRVACGDDMNKSVTLPSVFGFIKPKPICNGCFQLVTMLGNTE